MRIELSQENLNTAIHVIDQAPGAAKKAIRRAQNKTLRWTRTQVRRAVAREAQVPQKLLKGRFHLTSAKARDPRAILWVGLNPIPAIDAGNARQTKKGVTVGKHRFDHAFIATMPHGRTGVFLRVSRRRLPIVEQTINVQPSAGQMDDIRSRMLGRFNTLAAQELNFEFEKIRGTT